MKKQNILSEKQATFINYLLSFSKRNNFNLPSINQIGKDLELSTSCIREQIELARILGLIRIQPRLGISILPYDFAPAVSKSLYYAINADSAYFQQYSELRNQLEKSFFKDSARLLENSDIIEIQSIVNNAKKKLNGDPIQIPHQEHRSYHLKIYSKSKNIFVKGLLKSHWDMYELVGLDRFTDLTYLEKVWEYHDKIIKLISVCDYEGAYQMLAEHIDLIYERDSGSEEKSE